MLVIHIMVNELGKGIGVSLKPRDIDSWMRYFFNRGLILAFTMCT